jgi:hypothetical protein
MLSLFFTLLLTAAVSAHEESAHVRFGNFVFGGENVDVWVNGVAVERDFSPAMLGEFSDVQPGTLSVTIVPAGEGADDAIFPAQEIAVEADHLYTISVIGQVGDNSLMPLVIDETAAMEAADCDLSKDVFRVIINNVEGAPTISFYEADMWIEEDIPYGAYSARCFPAYSYYSGQVIVGHELGENVMFDFGNDPSAGGFWEPYTAYFYALMGSYPGNPGENFDFGGGSTYTLAPDPVSFLEAFSGLKLTGDSQTFFEFDTAAAAFKAAGLDEALMSGGPYTLFVPIDAALDALPAGTLDAWMADPDALANVLNYHVVPGAMTYDDLIVAGTVETLQGLPLTVTKSDDPEDGGAHFFLNGETRVSNFPYWLPDGSVVWFIDNNSVLMPPTE